MTSWQVGDVRITRVVELETVTPYRPKSPLIAEATPDALGLIPWLTPHFVTPEGHLKLAIQALLVEAPGMRLVVDTCIGNDKPRRMTANRGLATSFLHAFAATGWTRESVDVVVCTHLHVDHVGWNTVREGGRWVPTFPRAQYLIAQRELEHWQAEHDDAEQQTILGDSIQPIFDAGLVRLVETDHVLSPEVRLKPTPGHTPGHVSVAISSRGARALITGDAIHHPCQIAHPTWSVPFDVDRDAARAMRLRLLEELADEDVLVLGTHFADPVAGHVRTDGARYRFDV